MIGIYIITNLITNKYYIGCSINLKKRISKHKTLLRGNYHINEHLQSSFNKYGIDNFSFEILEECEEQFLYSQENYWCNLLNSHNRKYGYNILPTNPNGKSLFHSQETIDKIKMILNKNYQACIDRIEYATSCKILDSFAEYDLNGNFIRDWDNIGLIKNYYKIDSAGIYQCCKRQINNYKNKVWRYKGEEFGIMPKISKRKKILRVEDNKVYKSISEASRDLKCHHSMISRQLIGEYKHVKNFTFKYL